MPSLSASAIRAIGILCLIACTEAVNPFCTDDGKDCNLQCICALTSAGSCDSLKKCESSGIAGTLPTEIGLLSIDELKLADNAISGTIPTEIGSAVVSKELCAEQPHERG